MRIFKKTDRTLTLWQNNWPSPWILVVPLYGLVIAIIGDEAKLACYRATPLSGQCQLENNGFFNHQSRSISFNNIQKVDLEANSSEEEDASTKVLLITKDGKTLPVTLNGNAEERDQIANQLATFLETPTASTFKITDGSLNLSYLLAGISGLMGLAYLLSGGWTIVGFDKDRNECLVMSWEITGKKINFIAIDKIVGVKTENKELGYLKILYAVAPHRLTLVTKDQRTYPLGKKYLSSTLFPQNQKVADRIEEFLEIYKQE